MPTCTACGEDCPPRSRFCPSCGASQRAPAELAAERRVVTTLFADIVGFTALCEAADPEDVDPILWAYYHMTRGVIELFGGVVEKFIGDAVAGVFGIPHAHEDDPERAVRAALAIVDGMRTLPLLGDGALRVRVGVNTGRALVRMHVLPSSGEGFLVGDAVNTAARLLALAPPMRVVVGAATHELTSRVIAYDALGPVRVKGKARPIHPWLARAPVARRGVDLQTPEPRVMVGREVEMGVLSGLFAKAQASSAPQFALVTGEAGIGKSRLLLEFARRLDRTPGLICTWRQGRCPAYGQGLAFWPLGEVVKAHAGILDSDLRTQVEAKLAASLAGLDDRWVAERLRPLVGLPASQTTREDSFAAWLRFLENIARARPTVLVVEDLHWASEPMLAFLDHIRRHAKGVPLLVLATARPELLAENPGFASSVDAAQRIELKSLDSEEAGRLVDALGGADWTSALRSVVMERCGGNPLYTEEFLHYLRDFEGAPWDDVEAADRHNALPDSLQALIAARLDALPPERKAILSDAAVVGQVFWPGVVGMLGARDPDTLESALAELAARELIRRQSDSSVEGEVEYSFWHALTRYVAYEQLPRAVRAAKHAAIGHWLDATSGERKRDVVEMLALHFSSALDLARAAADKELADDVLAPTIRSLRAAGDVALTLDVSVAQRHYARAVDLAQADHPDRAGLLLAWGRTLVHDGSFREAREVYQEAALELRAAGDQPGAAAALRQADNVQSNVTGRSDEALLEEADLLDAREPSPQLAKALEYRAGWASWKSFELAISLANQAIEMCSQLGMPEPLDALESRGWSRAALGDALGLEDLRTALRLAGTPGHEHQRCGFFYNLAEMLQVYRGPRQALAVRREGLEAALARRDTWATGFCREGEFGDLVWSGDWDEAVSREAAVTEFLTAHEMTVDLQRLRSTSALLHTWRGEAAMGMPLAEWAEESSRPNLEPGSRVSSLVGLAVVSEALGDAPAAKRLLEETAALPAITRVHPDLVLRLPATIRSAVRIGEPHLAERLAAALPSARAYDVGILAELHALVAETEGDLAAAAAAWAVACESWRELGVPYELGLSLLGEGRCRAAEDAVSASKALLAEAHAIFSTLRAAPALAEAESLLQA